jgi:hypothetical protein
MDKAFETWVHDKTRFLAVPSYEGGNVFVLDEHGNNFGAWYSAEGFRRALAGRDPKFNPSEVKIPLNRVRLQVHPVT